MQAMAAGMRAVQNGESEGCLAFTLEVPGQADAKALKIAGVKKRRNVYKLPTSTLRGSPEGTLSLPAAVGGGLSA